MKNGIRILRTREGGHAKKMRMNSHESINCSNMEKELKNTYFSCESLHVNQLIVCTYSAIIKVFKIEDHENVFQVSLKQQ